MGLFRRIAMASLFILGCRLAVGGDTRMPVQVAQDGTTVSFS